MLVILKILDDYKSQTNRLVKFNRKKDADTVFSDTAPTSSFLLNYKNYAASAVAAGPAISAAPSA